MSNISRMLTMKRLGKPDTGNPSVRFDEGSELERELTIPVGLNSTSSSGLLYRRFRSEVFRFPFLFPFP